MCTDFVHVSVAHILREKINNVAVVSVAPNIIVLVVSPS